MKTAAVLSLFFAGVSAFVPAPVSKQAAPLCASKLDGEFGVGIEFGNKCPPLGAMLLEDAKPEALKWFQNAEIKHGRVAMVATIGFWIQKLGVHFPLYFGPSGSNAFHPESSEDWYLSESLGITFSDVAKASPLEAVSMVPAGGWLQIFICAGAFEAAAYYRQWQQDRTVPGDYGYDPLGFTKGEGGLESDKMKNLRLKEIKNGRLAMMTIAAWVSNEAIPGALPVWHP
uniref:Plastid light harvesting protein n=1 Tax=Cyclophora tenuis TaxID=216820 RepID=A0A7S1D252_CYCTE|mmetsp:Transcript_17189/g.29157  ORF Transcript_17189/g.29157 Transcript_17189/m.29157 type:complete len:229 (+) Transcript_17189:80-766(+)